MSPFEPDVLLRLLYDTDLTEVDSGPDGIHLVFDGASVGLPRRIRIHIESAELQVDPPTARIPPHQLLAVRRTGVDRITLHTESAALTIVGGVWRLHEGDPHRTVESLAELRRAHAALEDRRASMRTALYLHLEGDTRGALSLLDGLGDAPLEAELASLRRVIEQEEAS